MSSTSRTGLVPTSKKNFKLISKRKGIHDRLPTKFEAIPMPLTLRPFGGLFNPFAKGCSVLCNHPAPTGVRDIIHQFKTSLAIEGKNPQHAKEKFDAEQQKQQEQYQHLNESDNIPEDLFRRYTDTDSRPMTPSPTVTSVHTRTSATSFLNNRRCITPELGKNEIIKRKKIILDLRRSHSQETLYWKPTSSDLSQSLLDCDNKPKSAGANEEKKPKRQRSEEQRPKSSLTNAAATLPVEGAEEAKKLPQTCINEQELVDDDDVRRGKKRKKLKAAPATTTFHLSEDPETQVAALGPDSLNPSTRPSLIPNSISLLPNKDKRESEPVLLKGSFLTDDAFQALKTELDDDVIENTFGRYLNRALREAIKYIPSKPRSASKVIEEKDNHTFVAQPKMPRKFSKSATRFDVPLNLVSLETMSVLDYLSKYVWVSRQRKQLYKRVFLKYLSKTDQPDEAAELLPTAPLLPPAVDNPDADALLLPRAEYVERTMAVESLPQALEDALEFHGTPRNIAELLRLLEYGKLPAKELDFRAWCGVVSFAERLALDDPTCTDSCDELEKADFNSMEQRLGLFNISENLREVFTIIRHTHNLNY